MDADPLDVVIQDGQSVSEASYGKAERMKGHEDTGGDREIKGGVFLSLPCFPVAVI